MLLRYISGATFVDCGVGLNTQEHFKFSNHTTVNTFLRILNMISFFTSSFYKTGAAVVALLLSAFPSYALSPETFANTSKLATGNWAKIEVSESGMQFISNATIKNLGFTDPDKVNVYGFGGRVLPEMLYDSMPDDLPLIPSIKTPTGIVFFGHGCINWEKNNNRTAYKHANNPYSDHAYYFISDVEPSRASAPDKIMDDVETNTTLTTFTERLVHEQDLMAPVNTGRTLLGEDFRTQKKRSFQFNLPDIMGDAFVSVTFSAKTTNGPSSLLFTANDNRLASTTSDNIPAVSTDNVLYNTAQTVKQVDNPGEKLNLTIEFSTSGVLFIAALDHIEVEYERSLRLRNDELYFYLNPYQPAKVSVENCNESTIIWDVTDPLNPQNIKYSLSGDVATFVTPAETREYVAFNSTKITRQTLPAGRISNQDIHGMEIPEMVIITPDAYKSAAQRLADLHAATDKLRVAVVTTDAVYNEFSSGTPDLTAYRKMLKMWYDRGIATDGSYTRYCLLFGRPSYDNKMATPAVKNSGYPRIPIWQSPANGTSASKASSYSTDDYVGMLEDQDKVLALGSAKIMAAVGRMPVKSIYEANAAVDKLEKYLKNPVYGSWRNNVMLIADDQDTGQHLDQAESVYKAMTSNGKGADFLYEKLYLDSYKLSYGATGATYPEAKQRMFDKLAEGVGYINYIGHANPRSWTHEGLLTWTDIMSMTNTNLPFIYAATCEFLRWDDDEVSGGEELWLNKTAGVIGMICPSREVYIGENGTLNERTSKYMYMRNPDGSALRVGDVMINGKNDYPGNLNKLRYGLMGDPSLSVLSPSYSVAITSFLGKDTNNITDLPVIPARSSFEVSGAITDSEGNVIEDFNGIAEIQLYDAENVIVTNGNGKEGKVMTYNDRKSRLYSGRVRVTNGLWALTINMPSEIENNYSPALLSMYAYDDAGREANGSFDKFYVYGYDDNAPDDFDGPAIKEFYLNSPGFADGGSVSPSPVLYASFSDESGINVSDSGIGHNMTLSLDNKSFFNDVNLFYTADEDDYLAGSIAYPLKDIEPGEHTLKLTVWDNANNSSSKELTFHVSAAWNPEITQLYTDVSPAVSNVNFIVSTDGAKGNMECKIEVFDLNGKRVWTGNSPNITSSSTSVRLGWNLCDENGARVARGIYVYRAIVTTPEGATIVKSNKLAVASPI